MDIFETESELVVRAEIGGVRGEDFRVHVDGDRVRISGVRRVPEGHRAKRLHQMEIAFGPFERVVRVLIPFDRKAVTAHLEDGFLEVTLPKRDSKRRTVKVETE